MLGHVLWGEGFCFEAPGTLAFQTCRHGSEELGVVRERKVCSKMPGLSTALLMMKPFLKLLLSKAWLSKEPSELDITLTEGDRKRFSRKRVCLAACPCISQLSALAWPFLLLPNPRLVFVAAAFLISDERAQVLVLPRRGGTSKSPVGGSPACSLVFWSHPGAPGQGPEGF